jgi:hypothetical protein
MPDLNVGREDPAKPDPPVADPWDSGPDDKATKPPDPPVTNPWDSGPDDPPKPPDPATPDPWDSGTNA